MTNYMLHYTYDYAALEPSVSAQIMELHHDKHHQPHMSPAPTPPWKNSSIARRGRFYAESLVWKKLLLSTSPAMSCTPSSGRISRLTAAASPTALATSIDEHFGSFDAFRQPITQATRARPGFGLGCPLLGAPRWRLIIEQVYDHQGNVSNGSIPLLVFDAWEHAYYLQYKNVRADFVTASGTLSIGMTLRGVTGRRRLKPSGDALFAPPEPRGGSDSAMPGILGNSPWPEAGGRRLRGAGYATGCSWVGSVKRRTLERCPVPGIQARVVGDGNRPVCRWRHEGLVSIVAVRL